MAKKTTTDPRDSKNSKTKTQHGFAGAYKSMSQFLLEQRTEDTVKIAQQNLIENGYVTPVLQIFIKGTAIIFGLAGSAAMNRIPEIIKKYETAADAFILVTEGWVKDPTNTYRIGEAINVCAKSRSGNYGAVSVFSRDVNNKPVFDKTMYSSQVYCRHLDGVF
ncbi:MAG: hypothetical protein JZU65_12350 [Chlorobium sp.]|nr:hypothetical protein [Chlorobium sp.]